MKHTLKAEMVGKCVMVLDTNLLLILFSLASRCVPYVTFGEKKPSVEILRSPISGKFLRQCELSGGTQQRALSCYKIEEIKIIKSPD